MSTPLDLFGVVYTTGGKLVAALTFPSGLSAAAGTTLTGGTVSGTTNISTSATVIYAGMTESPSGSGQYSVSADIGGTTLPDTTTRPYTIEARVVPSGTDLTSYSGIGTAFAASTTVAYSVGPVVAGGGYLRAGVWSGDLAGKVLGGGSSAIGGVGVQADTVRLNGQAFTPAALPGNRPTTVVQRPVSVQE